jgi:ketosteroid isomerase-like protein
VYAWLVERLIRRAFDRLSRGEPSAVLAIFGAGTRFSFPGSSSWGIDTTDQAAIEAWFRRFASLGVEFTIHDVVVKGPPWNTKVRTRGSDRIATTSGAEYTNHWVQCAHLAWGKLTEDVVYLDTERLAAFDSVLTAANG